MRAYAQGYAGWVEDTAQAIEQGRFAEIDRVALADEVRDLGKSEHVAEGLSKSPSLRPEIPVLLARAYKQARIDAANGPDLTLWCSRDTRMVCGQRAGS